MSYGVRRCIVIMFRHRGESGQLLMQEDIKQRNVRPHRGERKISFHTRASSKINCPAKSSDKRMRTLPREMTERSRV
jgi:hypothetical protein